VPINFNETEWRIINAVRAKGKSTRNNIIDITGLSWGSVSKMTNNLLNENIIIESKNNEARDAQYLSVNPDLGYFLGISIGSSFTRMELIDFDFQTIGLCDGNKDESEFSFETSHSFSELIQDIRRHMKNFIDNRPEAKKLLGVGIAWPGAVSNNIARYSPTMPYLSELNLNLQELFTPDQYEFFNEINTITNKPKSIIIDSYSKCAVAAEYLVGGENYRIRNAKNMACLIIGTGITAGLILNNQIYGGSNNYAGQISYFTLEESGKSKNDHERQKKIMLGEMMRDYLQNKQAEEIDEELKRRLGKWVGQSISYITNLLNPELVVLTGRFGKTLFTDIYPTLREHVGINTWHYGLEGLRIEQSKLGRNSAAIGAAIMSYRNQYGSII